MTKNFRRLATLAAIPLLLAGCAQKVDFETFKEKANAAVEARDDKEPSYFKVKGTWDDEAVNFSTESAKDMTFGELAIATVLLTEIDISIYTVAEKDGVTYSVGGGFVISYKTTDDEGDEYSWKRTYNAQGYLTNYAGVQDEDKTNVTITYVYKK
jgi:hypothetical protein